MIPFRLCRWFFIPHIYNVQYLFKIFNMSCMSNNIVFSCIVRFQGPIPRELKDTRIIIQHQKTVFKVSSRSVFRNLLNSLKEIIISKIAHLYFWAKNKSQTSTRNNDSFKYSLAASDFFNLTFINEHPLWRIYHSSSKFPIHLSAQLSLANTVDVDQINQSSKNNRIG